MSWLFSQALVEAFSEASSSDGEPSAPLSVMPTPHPFWWRDKTTDFCTRSPFGQTLPALTADRGEELLMWFRAGFPARTLAAPETRPALMANAPASGARWCAWLAKFNRSLSAWRTPQLSLLEDSGECLETWPRSGMTRDGTAFQLPSAACHTSATGLGLMPTPTVQQGRNRTSGRSNPDSGHHDGVTLMDWLWLNVGQVKQKPSFVEWMMDWPIGWTALEPLATDKFQQWLSAHTERSPMESEEASP